MKQRKKTGRTSDPVKPLQRDSLAKAVQWYSPDLSKQRISHECLTELERLLSVEEMKKDSNYNRLSRTEKLEFLIIYIKK